MLQLNNYKNIVVILILVIATIVITTSSLAQVQPKPSDVVSAPYDKTQFDTLYGGKMLKLDMIKPGTCDGASQYCEFGVIAPDDRVIKIDIKAGFISPVGSNVISRPCQYFKERKILGCQFRHQFVVKTNDVTSNVLLAYSDGRYPGGTLYEAIPMAKMPILPISGTRFMVGNTYVGGQEVLFEANGVINKDFRVGLALGIEDGKFNNVIKINFTHNRTNAVYSKEVQASQELITTAFNIPESGVYRMSACRINGANCDKISVSNGGIIEFQVFAKPLDLQALSPDFPPLIDADRVNIVIICSQDFFNSTYQECKDRMIKDFNFSGKPYLLDKNGQETKVDADVRHLSYGLFATEPYKIYKSRFNFWIANDIVNVNNELVMDEYIRAIPSYTKLLTLSKLKLFVNNEPTLTPNASAFAPQFISGPIKNRFETLSYNPTFTLKSGPFILSHEFNHAFAALEDEYPNSKTTPGTNNCADSQPIAETRWSDKVGKVDPFTNEWLSNLNKYPLAKDLYANARKLNLSNTDFIKVGYKLGGCSTAGVKNSDDTTTTRKSIMPTTNSLMRGGSDGIDPLGSVNRDLAQEVLNLYTGGDATKCNNERDLPDCSNLTKSTAVCPRLVYSFKVSESEYDTTTGYCKNKTTHSVYGIINFGAFPKSIIDECKRITPVAQASECTTTIDVDFYGARLTIPYLNQSKLQAIKGTNKDKCMKTNKPVPYIKDLSPMACMEEIKLPNGTIEKSIYGVFASKFINLNTDGNASKYGGRVPVKKVVDTFTGFHDSRALYDAGIK
jgi:hypothetical protein